MLHFLVIAILLHLTIRWFAEKIVWNFPCAESKDSMRYHDDDHEN